MPSGRIHAVTTLTLAVGMGAAAHSQGWPAASTAALAGGSLAGLLLSPDLDVDRGCISYKFARQGFGRLVGMLWAMLWQPYALIVPHRHWLSHLPVISTILRLGWLLLPVFAWQWLTHHTIWLLLPGWFNLFFLGLVWSDVLHWFLDLITRKR